MIKGPRTLTDKAITDLEEISSVPEEDIENVISTYSQFIQDQGMEVLSQIEDTVGKEFKISPVTVRALTNFIFFLSRIGLDDKSISNFQKDMESVGFSKAKVRKIHRIIDIARRKGIIDSLLETNRRIEIENFGLPHLSTFEFMTDYRVLKNSKGNRTIVPVVICHLDLHPAEIRKEPYEVAFQFTPDSLDKMINSIQDFKENMKADLEYIEKIIRTRGD